MVVTNPTSPLERWNDDSTAPCESPHTRAPASALDTLTSILGGEGVRCTIISFMLCAGSTKCCSVYKGSYLEVYLPMEWVVTCHVTCPANPVTKVFDLLLMYFRFIYSGKNKLNMCDYIIKWTEIFYFYPISRSTVISTTVTCHAWSEKSDKSSQSEKLGVDRQKTGINPTDFAGVLPEKHVTP